MITTEEIVKQIAKRIAREIVFLSPNPAFYIEDPEGLLDWVRDTSGSTNDQMADWVAAGQQRPRRDQG